MNVWFGEGRKESTGEWMVLRREYPLPWGKNTNFSCSKVKSKFSLMEHSFLVKSGSFAFVQAVWRLLNVCSPILYFTLWKSVLLSSLSCVWLCNLIGRSPPGSSVHGDSPGKNTGVGCHSLLHGIFPTQGLNLCLLLLPVLANGFFTTSATWEAHVETVWWFLKK